MGDLRRVLGIRATPIVVGDTKWHRVLPQYELGHADVVLRLTRRLAAEQPGIHLTGNSYRGVGLDDTIRNAVALGTAVSEIAAQPTGLSPESAAATPFRRTA